MLHALLHSCDDLINTNDGACWWILALDGILLIPLIFAMFFYPMAALSGVAVIAILTFVAIAIARAAPPWRGGGSASRNPPRVL
jgi:hypothetical protein